MSFRSRPVLDRRHRPRWQDELRTQQLTVVGFAVAIALALGIFGATVWTGYWDAHVRPVAAVAGTTYDRSDLDQRQRILIAEASADIAELQVQLGGPRDQFLQAQIDQISAGLQDPEAAATTSLVDGAVLASQADEFGVSVSEEEVDAGIAERHTVPELFRAQLILVNALPDDAATDAEPTDEQLEAARDEAQAARDRVEDGEDFAAVAAEVSDDLQTGSLGGALGAFGPDDALYGAYAEALEGAEIGDLVGPVEVEGGYAVLELLDYRERSTDGPLADILTRQGVEQAAYRAFVREELLVEAFRTHFGEQVIGTRAPQQRVAQIFIAALTGTPAPQERARHVLIQPLPDAQDQSTATEEQWAAALMEAEEVRALLEADDADWFAIAEERSHDRGSGARGGDLGWYDPANTGFVAEFSDALAALEVGELSEPVRSDFGWHVIQKTAERLSPQAQAEELVDQLREDPDRFAEVATRLSEDYETARHGGELGWVARYQLEPELEEVVFSLTEVGEISDAHDAGAGGITIYQLLESSEERDIEPERLAEIRASGFDRWLESEVRAPVEPWVDPDLAPSTTDA
jgi:parvulin-like peptidyl-prolyl isomerase